MHYAEWDPKAVLTEQNKSFNTLRKFAIAFWKTSSIQLSYKCYYLKVFLISLIFLPFLSLMRGLTIPKVTEKIIHSPIDINSLDRMRSELKNLNDSSMLPENKIYFCPNYKPYEAIIKLTVKKLKLEGYESVDNDYEMESRMQKKSFLAGVKFLEAKSSKTEIPLGLDYVLRFPPLLRTSRNPKNPLLWVTDKLYSQVNEREKRSTDSNYTNSPPGYFEEGFVQLQHAIAISYLELKSGYLDLAELHIPKIQMLSFPYRRHVRDEYILYVKVFLALSMVWMYVIPSYVFVKAVTDENERGIMKMMRIEKLNWCAWLFFSFLMQLISSLSCLIILGPSWGAHSIFQYSDLFPVFCFFLCYICANCTFVLMIAFVLIRKSKNAKYALFIRLFTIAPYPFILYFYYEIPFVYKILSCLCLDTGLAIGINIILEFESSGEGFKFKNYAIPHFSGENFTELHVVGMLLLDSVLYMLILLYFHHKYPPEVLSIYIDKETMAKSWYYPMEAIFKFIFSGRLKQQIFSFLVEHLTVHEDNLESNQIKPIQTEYINDKRSQTIRPSMVDQATMTTRRLYSASTTDKELSPTRFRRNRRLQRSVPYKRRAPLQNAPTSSTDSSYMSLYKRTLHPEPLQTWSFDEKSSCSSQEPDSPPSSEDSSQTDLAHYKNPIVNDPLFDEHHGIQVIDVSKKIRDTHYLKNISMVIHPNEITVILMQQHDRNMSLTHIIAGNVPATSGKVIINGHDLQHYKGTDTLCSILPTESIIFSQLTTCENLYFYMHLRGMRNHRQITREILKYLELLQMDLLDAELVADFFSFGLARCMSLCCALCGGNHAVIVEDPCLGLNHKWKYRMWDLLKAVSHNRVIIVKTHYCDEAEFLGERIAVMYCGSLQCYDRAKYLKENFCNNYHVHCDVVEENKLQDNEFMALLHKHFPREAHAQFLPSSGKVEVTVPCGLELQLADLITELEEKGKSMGLGFIWVKQKNLSDVFMTDTSENSELLAHAQMNRILYKCLDSSLNEQDEFNRKSLQFCALIHKQMIQLIRYFWIPVAMLLLLAICVFLNLQSSHFSHLPRINLSETIYRDTVVLMKLHADLEFNSCLYHVASGYVQHHGRIQGRAEDQNLHRLMTLYGRREMIPYILFLQMVSVLHVETFYVAAAEFTPDIILAYWNNKLLHSAPISLNMMHNALAYHLLGKDAEIRVANHPIKFSNERVLDQYNIHSGMEVGLGSFLLLALCATLSLLVVPLISDYVTGNRRVIYLSGNNMTMYWVSHLLGDILITTLMSIYLVALLVLHDVLVNWGKRNYDDINMICTMFVVLFLFCLAVVPFIYLLAVLFDRIFIGFMITLLILGGSSIVIVIIIQLSHTSSIQSLDFVYHMFIWSPTMNLYRAMRNVHVNRALRRVCEQLGGCNVEEACCRLPDYMGYEYPGIFSFIVVSLLLQISYIALLSLLLKHPFIVGNFLRWIRNKMRFRKAEPSSSTTSIASDVLAETDRVDKLMKKDYEKYPLIFSNVTKRVGNQIRLNKVSFAVEPQEVLGILGICTSGKTEIMTLTVSYESLTSGEIYVDGVNVRQHPTDTYSNLGYCPGGNSLLGYMTVWEILKFYCLLNGRKAAHLPSILKNLCQALHLDEHMNKRIDSLGFSERRQLSVGISVLSSKKTVIIDEPTRGVSQESKIRIWQLIHVLKDVGRTVVMSSEDIDETIELCDNIAIMVNGSLQNIGTVDQLTKLFSRGCSVEIRTIQVINKRFKSRSTYEELIGRHFFSDSDDDEDKTRDSDYTYSSEVENDWTFKAVRYDNVLDFMEFEMPFAELQEKYGHHLLYYIPFEATSLSNIFRAMSAVKEHLDVYNFRITRSSLSEVYEKASRQRERVFRQKTSM